MFATLREQLGGEALAFRHALDLDGDRLHCLLDAGQAVGQVAGDGACVRFVAAPVETTGPRARERQPNDDDGEAGEEGDRDVLDLLGNLRRIDRQ